MPGEIASFFKVTITGTFNSETRVYDYSSDRTRDEVNEAVGLELDDEGRPLGYSMRRSTEATELVETLGIELHEDEEA